MGLACPWFICPTSSNKAWYQNIQKSTAAKCWVYSTLHKHSTPLHLLFKRKTRMFCQEEEVCASKDESGGKRWRWANEKPKKDKLIICSGCEGSGTVFTDKDRRKGEKSLSDLLDLNYNFQIILYKFYEKPHHLTTLLFCIFFPVTKIKRIFHKQQESFVDNILMLLYCLWLFVQYILTTPFIDR